MTAPSGRHETERCTCGLGVGLHVAPCPRAPFRRAAPPPVEGETEGVLDVPAGGGVGGPGAAKVNRLRAHLTPPVVGDQPEETDTVNDEPLPVVECPACGASIRARMADAPAVGAEVRVEWGVRYRFGDEGSQVSGRLDQDDARIYATSVAQVDGVHSVEVIRRTVLTSAWQPVTDEEAGA